MSHIDCHSYVTGRDVKYSLIGVKLKHKVKQEDYGTSANYTDTFLNTSPAIEMVSDRSGSPYDNTHVSDDSMSIYTTQGGVYQGYQASGELESEYENHNTGVNPIITSNPYDVNEFEYGVNTRELFETDTVKIILEIGRASCRERV